MSQPSSSTPPVIEPAQVTNPELSNDPTPPHGSHGKQSLPLIALGALGVVFGDIGTSPLYAFKECFHASHGIAVTLPNVLGILSLIFWAITIVVSLKYVLFIMRADNQGEGGIMALLALNMRNNLISPMARRLLVVIGLFGAALFFGDAIITPAVSVMSAVEGLQILAPRLDKFVLPITIGILFGLFALQSKGTGSMGRFFGPIMLLWFVLLGVFGLMRAIDNPAVLGMVNPLYAIQFVMAYPGIAFIVMGSVVLTITGGEALYADMGHFGRLPIRLAWFVIVLPCLVLNYAGQGALILSDPKAVENPFYLLTPDGFLAPMIVLATLATVIASQAVISGVFSIARQAMQLGYLPRMTVTHTSEHEIGQVYVPFLNWLLLIAVIVLVLMFRSSENLASAYGIAVTMTMICDTILVAFVTYYAWRWPLWRVLLIAIPFLIPDLIFFAATSRKVLDGGWVPLIIGGSAFLLMMTWRDGKTRVQEVMQAQNTLSLQAFTENVAQHAQIVPGIAVFMTTDLSRPPHSLMHNLKHNKVLHQFNILMRIKTEDVPYVAESSRFELERINEHFAVVTAHYGFKGQPNVPDIVERVCAQLNLPFNPMEVSYFVSRERLFSTRNGGFAPWREKLFISMARNTSSASDFFQIPTNRVVEVGSQVEI